MNFLRKYHLVIITILAFICSSSSCIEEPGIPRIYSKFYIENNDDDIIYVFDIYRELSSKPNRSNSEKPVLTVDYIFETQPSRIFTLSPGERSKELSLAPLENLYPERNPVCDHYITIWRKETMDKYSKQELREKNIYDAQYILSSDQISAMGSVVHYPLEGYVQPER